MERGMLPWLVVLLVAGLGLVRSELVRRNFLALSGAEQQDFFDAVNMLKEERNASGWSTYDSFVTLHSFNTRFAHAGPAFFPWHRAMLLEFERELRRVSQKPNLTIPYWDWSNAATRMRIWEPHLFGGNGSHPDALVRDGRFAHWTTTVSLEGKLVHSGINRAWGTALRDMIMAHKINTDEPPVLPSVDEVLYALSLPLYDTAPWSDESHNPPSFRNTFEGWELTGCRLHNTVHLWVGGHMRVVAIAPNDPVFWLHHAFVDKVWAVWQQLHAPKDEYGGYAPAQGAREGHNLHDQMRPFGVTPADMASIRKLGYTYAHDALDDIVAAGGLFVEGQQ